MKERIIVALVCVPLFFIVLFFLPSPIFTGVIAIVCAICAYELLHATGAKGNERVAIYAVFAAALIPIGTYFDIGELVFIAVFLALMCMVFIEALFLYKRRNQITFAQITATLFGGAVVPLLLSTLVSLKVMQEGRLLVLMPVVSAFVTDAGAYFSGRFFGKRKAFPLISPKKTVEGCIGGLIVGTAAMFLYGVILFFSSLHDIKIWALILYGVVGAVVTELGDLAFSFVKREFNVKDFGRLLPGHGGMLDRFDSMVFTAPAVYLLVLLIPAIIVRN